MGSRLIDICFYVLVFDNLLMYTRKEWQKFLETMEEIGVTDEREIAKLKKDYFGFEEEEQSTIKKLRGRKKQDKSNIIVKKE